MGTLRHIARVIGLMTLLPLCSLAQDNRNGVYRTEADFVNHVLTDTAPTDDQNRISHYRKTLTVYRNGDKTRYSVRSISGYFQNGVTYRGYYVPNGWLVNGYYRIEKEGALVIYSRQSTHHRSDGYRWNYYSVGLQGNIRRITKKNLGKDFGNRPEFLKAALEKLKTGNSSSIAEISDLYAIFNKQQ